MRRIHRDAARVGALSKPLLPSPDSASSYGPLSRRLLNPIPEVLRY